MDITRDLVARKVPDLDLVRGPQVREHATACGVEGASVRPRVLVDECAPGVVAVDDGALLSGQPRRGRCLMAVGGGAAPGALGGVERVLVGRLVVHAFEDVDFAGRRPVFSDAPIFLETLFLEYGKERERGWERNGSSLPKGGGEG